MKEPQEAQVSERKIEDGGPAFPCTMTKAAEASLRECGFPVQFRGGMSLRDYFAGLALDKCIQIAYSENAPKFGPEWRVMAAQDAYLWADAMLKAKALGAEVGKGE